jgi:C4-dicarboxylate transporter, DctM subunit
VVVFGLIVTGIYRGWFSASEGAAVGAFLMLVFAVVQGGMRMEGFIDSIRSAGLTTAMMFLIMLSAELFSAALASSQMPTELAKQVAAINAPPYLIVLCVVIAYMILGCFMESLAMVLLTLPVFIPLVLSLDLGLTKDAALVWFGILVLMSVEIGMISPPFGLNLFLINGMAKDVPMKETYKGVLGFCVMDVLRVMLILFIPMICLWLPGLK